MSTTQNYIQALQRIIRHLQQEIEAIQDIINQLRQAEDSNLIIIEAEPIFDDNEPIHFELPPALLQQETEGKIHYSNPDSASQIAVSDVPVQQAQLTRRQQLEDAQRRAREWAAERYLNRS